MKKRSDRDGWDDLQRRILGLGESSARKSYYPALRRKLAELERTEEELRAANERLRALVETTPDWIWEIDGEGRYTYSSPQVEALLGYRPEEVLGKTPFDFMPADEARRLRDQLLPSFLHGLPIRGVVNVNVHRDGHEVVMETSGTPILDAEGHLAGYRGSDRDITARVRAEEESRGIERKMLDAQKLESLGVLAGGIAHDFNNLLTAILGNAELARADATVSADAAARLDDVIRTSGRASELCRQMLAYAGQGRFVTGPIDLSRLVREMSEILRVSIGKKVRLQLDLDPHLPTVSGDATQLRQVVLNLITNASEAIGDADGTITLATSAARCEHALTPACGQRRGAGQTHCVRLIVRDDGCGMDHQTRSRIFEPFFTTKFTGRGLGMAAVSGIVRGHGGQIHVDSEPGAGTTFEIHLPAIGGAARADEPTGSAADPWTGAGTVLLADDEDAVRGLAERILRRIGFDVVCARDGQEAVELWQAH
ncbi:MAG: hybrid sensor histidine kinase/response regulator, partial [Gemmatimonadota bacterium]